MAIFTVDRVSSRAVSGKQKSVKGLHFEVVEDSIQEGVLLTVHDEHGEPIDWLCMFSSNVVIVGRSQND